MADKAAAPAAAPSNAGALWDNSPSPPKPLPALTGSASGSSTTGSAAGDLWDKSTPALPGAADNGEPNAEEPVAGADQPEAESAGTQSPAANIPHIDAYQFPQPPQPMQMNAATLGQAAGNGVREAMKTAPAVIGLASHNPLPLWQYLQQGAENPGAPPAAPPTARNLTGNAQQDIANFPNNVAASWNSDIAQPFMEGIPALSSAITERAMQSMIPQNDPRALPMWANAFAPMQITPGARPVVTPEDFTSAGKAVAAGAIDLAKTYSPIGPHGWRGGVVANNLFTHPAGAAADAASVFMGAGGPKLLGSVAKNAIRGASKSRFAFIRAIPDKLRKLQEIRLAREFEGVARSLDAEGQRRLNHLHQDMSAAWNKIDPAEQLQMMAHREGTETIHNPSPAAHEYLKKLDKLLDETTKILEGDNALKLRVISRVDKALAKWGPMMQQLASEDGTPRAIEDFKTGAGNLNELGKDYMRRSITRSSQMGRQPGYVPHKSETAMKAEVGAMTSSSPLVELKKTIKDLNDKVEASIVAPFTGRTHGVPSVEHTMNPHLAALGTAAQVERFRLYAELLSAAETVGAAHGGDLVDFPIKQRLKDAYNHADQLAALPPPAEIERMADSIKMPKWTADKLDRMFKPPTGVNAAFDEFRASRVGRALSWTTARYVQLSLGLKPAWPVLQGAQNFGFNQMGMWRVNPFQPRMAARELTASITANMLVNDDRARDILKTFAYAHVPGVPDRELLADPLARTIADKSVSLHDKYLAFEKSVTSPVFNAAQSVDNTERMRRAAYLLMTESLKEPGAMGAVWRKGIDLDAAIERLRATEASMTLPQRAATEAHINELAGDYSKAARYELRAVAFVLPYCQWLPHLLSATNFMFTKAPFKTNYLRHTAIGMAPDLQPADMPESAREGGGVYRRNPQGGFALDNRGQRQVVKQTYFNPIPADAAADVASQAIGLGQGTGELPRGGQSLAPWLQMPAFWAGRNPNNWRKDIYESDAPPLRHGEARGVDPALAVAGTVFARPWGIARDTALAAQGGLQGTPTSFNGGLLNVSRDRFGYPIKYGSAEEFGARTALGLRFMSENKTKADEQRMGLLDNRSARRWLARHPGMR